ncbi:MAG: flagellin [Fibrobacterota bacterium]
MRINHNIAAMTGHGSLVKTNRSLGKSIEKLSTGLRINRASDDAAGLSVSENLRTQVRGSNMAIRNANDVISALQIGEGAANEISDMLQRMRELAVQASNDTLTSTERTYLNTEAAALSSEIDRIADSTKFNGITLLNGTADTNLQTAHVGPNDGDGLDLTTVTDADMTEGTLGTDAIDLINSANSAISTIDTAIDSVNSDRSSMGSMVNRLEHTVNNLYNSATNLQAAESAIRDVDFAVETTSFTKNSILVQSSTAMLAQANAVPQSVLGLLGG